MTDFVAAVHAAMGRAGDATTAIVAAVQRHELAPLSRDVLRRAHVQLHYELVPQLEHADGAGGSNADATRHARLAGVVAVIEGVATWPWADSAELGDGRIVTRTRVVKDAVNVLHKYADVPVGLVDEVMRTTSDLVRQTTTPAFRLSAVEAGADRNLASMGLGD